MIKPTGVDDAVMELKAVLDAAKRAIQDAQEKIASADKIVKHLTDQEKRDAGLD